MSPITNLLGQLPNQLLLTVLGRLLIEWGPLPNGIGQWHNELLLTVLGQLLIEWGPLPNVIGQLHNGWDPLCDVNVRAVT